MNESKRKPLKNGPLEKFLAIILSVGFMFPGILSIMTNHYYAVTRSGAEINVDGQQAIIIGIGVIIFGLFPLCMLAKKPKIGVIWASLCLIFGLTIMILSKLFTNLIFG